MRPNSARGCLGRRKTGGASDSSTQGWDAANKAPPVSFSNLVPNQLKHAQSTLADGALQGIAASLHTGSHGHLEAAVGDKGGMAFGVFFSPATPVRSQLAH